MLLGHLRPLEEFLHRLVETTLLQKLRLVDYTHLHHHRWIPVCFLVEGEVFRYGLGGYGQHVLSVRVIVYFVFSHYAGVFEVLHYRTVLFGDHIVLLLHGEGGVEGRVVSFQPGYLQLVLREEKVGFIDTLVLSC